MVRPELLNYSVLMLGAPSNSARNDTDFKVQSQYHQASLNGLPSMMACFQDDHLHHSMMAQLTNREGTTFHGGTRHEKPVHELTGT